MIEQTKLQQWQDRCYGAEAKNDKLKFAVENFLAVLFRDGGHKTGEFNTLPEALYYARDVAIELIHHKDDHAREIGKLTEEISDLKQKIGELRAIL